MEVQIQNKTADYFSQIKTADEKIIEYRSLMDSIQSLSSDSTPNLDNVKIIIEKAERARTLIE